MKAKRGNTALRLGWVAVGVQWLCVGAAPLTHRLLFGGWPWDAPLASAGGHAWFIVHAVVLVVAFIVAGLAALVAGVERQRGAWPLLLGHSMLPLIALAAFLLT